MSHMDETLGVVSDDALRRAAQAQHGNTECEIEPDGRISHAQEGAWVQAWVWVPYTSVRST